MGDLVSLWEEVHVEDIEVDLIDITLELKEEIQKSENAEENIAMSKLDDVDLGVKSAVLPCW